MKKFLALILIVLVLAVNTIPVMAKPQTAVAPLRLAVVSPTSGYPGETIQVSVMASNVGKRPARIVGWIIRFPKDLVSAVHVESADGRIKEVSTTSEFVFVWNGVVKGGKVAEVRMSVTLRTDVEVGTRTLVSALDAANLHMAVIEILEPRLTVTSNAPDVVSKGGVIFFIEVTLTNSTPVGLPFDMAATVFFSGTNRNIEYSFTGGEIWGFDGSYTGAILCWRGVVPAGQSFTLTVKTASGRYPGTFDLLGLTDLLHPENLYATRMIIIQ
ncbi:TPA: hypothetical protein DIU27_04835 [Candidatus Collierbacteria bacterium]|uniref:DUF11 domain-containing protein n=1 Tax=Candidatus Collierbacteria bacterium GW2011_GWB2_44_22 TaxID=1618387 RepID=A0A0G1HVV5_9BACT|nr:MAG: hypothetical protein UW31_C0002G0008 [Candidatus Collierbacteria bacterium GW2011_GWA2_44_13]KKT51216.1 MAG: hypothetical protein UW44_C0014G0008 [Candidatus Collierbacteria bacterium GW2011_GWB2_44_22]KKT62176.1 MAG: hypothetical protein UW56_C0010G0008 [Candidatus Collierbacteria bacterium GW2011_GWD1_44_27]KKT65673.1 MAG: hypothetical protein UW58_C0023G0016 [Candidatus Collierbacteria bacterium GW2011_GWC2_44_30]KKT68796.1 MAG: hypothetical protein UW64_C0009G0008 [Microgenomates gr